MSKQKPFVVFAFATEGTATSPRYGGFAARLQKAGALPGHDIVTVALENIAFCFTEDGGLDVFDTVSGIHLADAAFVYLKSWESMPEEAAALALYLSHKGVPCIDTAAMGMGVSKLATAVRLWTEQLAVPASVYVRNADRLLQVVAERASVLSGGHFIAKDIVGSKGKHNYLVTAAELRQTIQDNPDISFICQRFIPNDGDYRVGVYMDKARFVIRRRGSGNTHLNNTSMGGQAEYIPVEAFPHDLQQLAEEAAAAAELQIAGVDIILDKTTQRPYILEVNQGSQIVTGAFVEENTAAFAAALNSAIGGKYARSHTQPLPLIGRQSAVALPELGITNIIAKVDSGAYSTTLHAENIHTETRDGVEELVFDVVAGEKLQLSGMARNTIRTSVFTQQRVRSSNGRVEQRFGIETEVVVQGKPLLVRLTLSDRSRMQYPMLIGRHALRSRFLINVELTQDSDA